MLVESVHTAMSMRFKQNYIYTSKPVLLNLFSTTPLFKYLSFVSTSLTLNKLHKQIYVLVNLLIKLSIV